MTTLTQSLQHKIDLKTKPLGALGQLEKLALKIGLVQESESPVLKQPHLIVFAGDHGITQSGVSAYPADVTVQMVQNFLHQGAAINVFCRQNKIALQIVDAGINGHIDNPQLIDHSIRQSTTNFLTDEAMNATELARCFSLSEQLVDKIAAQGSNVIGFGEMGIGNTSASAMLVHYLTDLSLADAVGRGTGLDDQGIQKKLAILKDAKAFHGVINDPKTVLQTFGGFEIAQMTGAMLAGYRKNMLLLIDGYIASAALLVASKLEPEILSHCVFCHQSDESGHQRLLEYFNAEPLLKLGMRLGEGTGCALAYPLLQSAVNFLNEMASFESAGVSNKDD